MRRTGSWWFSVLVVALSAGVQARGAQSVRLEAESASEIAPPMQIASDDEANGGEYLRVPKGSEKFSGHAIIPFKIEKAGEYILWGRVFWTDACGNSMFVSMDNGPRFVLGEDATYNAWHWRRCLGPLVLLRGERALRLANREDGTAIDTILLTDDPNYVPADTLSAHRSSTPAVVFNDDFTRAADDIGIWQCPPGQWRICRALDPNGVPEYYSYEAVAGAGGMSLAGFETWEDYRAAVSLKLMGEGSAGLVFCYSNDSYYLWQLACGKEATAELCSVQKGKTTTLFRRGVFCPSGQWYRLGAEATRDGIAVSLDGAELFRKPSKAPRRGAMGLFARSTSSVYFDSVEARSVEPKVSAELQRRQLLKGVPEKLKRQLSKDTDWCGPAGCLDASHLRRLVFSDSFERPWVLTNASFPDFAASDLEQMMRTRPDYYRREDQVRPVIDDRADQEPLLIALRPQSCTIADGELKCLGPEPSGGWVNRMHGRDVRLAFTVRRLKPGTAVCATIAAERGQLASGYVLRIDDDSAELLRAGKSCCSVKTRRLAVDSRHEVALERRGGKVAAWLDGEMILLHADSEPLPAKAAAFWCESGDAAFDDLSLTDNYQSGYWRVYSFENPEPMWWLQPGRWTLHGGIACVPGSNWISALASTVDGLAEYTPHNMTAPPTKQGAVMWCKERFSGNFRLECVAAEYTKWHGWNVRPDSHTHFYYRNVGITIGADGSNLRSGYSFIIGGWDNRVTCLARNEKIVARSDRVIRGRTTEIGIVKEGNELRLLIDEALALEYRDPEPLTGDRIAIWAWSSPVNIRDLYVHSDYEPEPTTRAEMEALDEDILGFIGELEQQNGGLVPGVADATGP